MPDPDPSGADPTAFWLMGDLPPVDDGPPAPAIDRLARPDITVDGRNLADLLRPGYEALTDRPPP